MTRKKPLQKAFVISVAQLAASTFVPGCSNPPPVNEEPSCPLRVPADEYPCFNSLTCSYFLDDGCHNEEMKFVCDMPGSTWKTTRVDNVAPCDSPAICPDRPPTDSASCSEFHVCVYWYDHGCGPQFDLATCSGSRWDNAKSPKTCDAPAPPDCAAIATETECAMNAECRWLAPSASMPTLGQAACFLKRDCIGNLDCPHPVQTCEQINVQCTEPGPCFFARVCLPNTP